jgi:hypothetical protein
MKAAGHEMENAGSDTVAAGTDTYHATKRAVKDTTITAEVKPRLKKTSSLRRTFMSTPEAASSP